MERSREELGRIHKEKCKELKQIRAKMAEDLGVELHQTECTYEGYCSGTCPKCKQEEWKLNAALMKRQLQEADIKRKVAAAGLTTVAALCLSGCNGIEQVDGGMEVAPYVEYEGAEEYRPTEDYIDELEGDVMCLPPEEEESVIELEGDVAYEE